MDDNQPAGSISFKYGDIVEHIYSIHDDGTVKVEENRENPTGLLTSLPLVPKYNTNRFRYSIPEEAVESSFRNLADQTGPGSYYTDLGHEENYATIRIEVGPEYLDPDQNSDFNYIVLDQFTVDNFPQVQEAVANIVGRRPGLAEVDTDKALKSMFAPAIDPIKDPKTLRSLTRDILEPTENHSQGTVI